MSHWVQKAGKHETIIVSKALLEKLYVLRIHCSAVQWSNTILDSAVRQDQRFSFGRPWLDITFERLGMTIAYK